MSDKDAVAAMVAKINEAIDKAALELKISSDELREAMASDISRGLAAVEQARKENGGRLPKGGFKKIFEDSDMVVTARLIRPFVKAQ